MSDAAGPAEAIPRSRSIVGSQSGANRGRYFRDGVARVVVWVGGLGVIGALLLIFVYLLSEVMPLFLPATVTPRDSFALPGPAGATLYVSAEEQGEVGLRVVETGDLVFFDLHDGRMISQFTLPLGGETLRQVTDADRGKGLLALQAESGDVALVSVEYEVTYDANNKRIITPGLSYPYGERALAFTDGAMRSLAARIERDRFLMAGVDASGVVHLKRNQLKTSLFGEAELSEGERISFSAPFAVDRVFIDRRARWIYVVNDEAGSAALYDLGSEQPTLVSEVSTGSPIRAADLLAGDLSLMLAQADGQVSQWFPTRGADGQPVFSRVRSLAVLANDQATVVEPEWSRRTFAVGDAEGQVVLMHATSRREIWSGSMLDEPIALLAFNPRAQYLMAVGESGSARGFQVRNEHPEFSFSAIWQRVWYEGYDQPELLWQSSAAVSDFEPKFSLTPLAFGTLKAAFYAMLFAIPLAVLGAIFTANFMSAEMRQAVKPTIELMEALPTVILGFLAGLWLAPFIETNLLGVFLVLFLLPLSIPLFGLLWLRMPKALRLRVPPGWEAALLIPVVAGVVWFCFALAKPLEAMLFAGTMQQWMDQTLGIPYDQRNALVVGIAMGVAVIPNIYSIAEDAVFSVPRQLTLGSLALGATPWQTLIGVVLPTASPGIFSAIMIGVGRAVGETMIVLMATGNTAVIDPSLFQGLRTLSANIAVELPESEVGGTHFRLLFLAGLVLFIFTFMFNTLAEVVRQRLRQKYASI
jgi:phosphate transport system permease protein